MNYNNFRFSSFASQITESSSISTASSLYSRHSHRLNKVANPCVLFWDHLDNYWRETCSHTFYEHELGTLANIYEVPLYNCKPTFTTCSLVEIQLPQYSSLIEKQVSFDCFECVKSEAEELDFYCVELFFKQQFGNQYEYSDSDYGFHQLDPFLSRFLGSDLGNPENIIGRDFSYLLDNLSNLNTQSPITPLTCKHLQGTEPELIASSLLKGTGAGLYSAYQFMMVSSTQADIEKIIARWVIELAQLATSFTISNLFFTFLKLLNEFFSITSLISYAKDMFIIAYDFLKNISTQHSSEPILRGSSYFTDLPELASYEKSPLAIAAALSSITMIFAGVIMGKDISKMSQHKTLVTNIADAFANVAKLKNGLCATKEMFTSLNSMIYETIFNLLGIESESHLVRLVKETTVTESNDNKKIEVFEYAKFLIDPTNLVSIMSNKALRQRLEFTNSVIEQIRFSLANQITNIPSQMIGYLNSTYAELQKVRKAIANSSKGESSRFCPMWINFVGDSHTGKSQFCTIFIKYFVELLRQIEARESLNFDIPSDDNTTFFVNFCDKYETNYTGQMITIIDDFAQDKPGSTEQSSALKMITWASSVPYWTNQAKLESKGIPFTSKLLISTSNDLNLERTEIVSTKALKNRITLAYKFTVDNTKPKLKWFPRGVKIQTYDFHSGNVGEEVTPEKLIKDCVKRYVEWFKTQNELAEMRSPSEDLVTQIMNEMYTNDTAVKTQDSRVKNESNPGKSEDLVEIPLKSVDPKNKVTKLAATSRFRCMLWRHPGYKIVPWCDINIEVYDCNCVYHDDRNTLYRNYVQNTDVVSESIDDYFNNRLQLISNLESIQNVFARSYNWIKTIADKCLSNTWFKVIAGGVAVLITASWAYTMFKVETENEHQVCLEGSAKYSIGVRRAKAKKAVIATSGIENIKPMFNDNYSKNAVDIMHEVIIKRGLVVNMITKGLPMNQVNTGLRIFGTSILSNHHFFNSIPEGTEFEITFSDLQGKYHKISQIFSTSRMYRIADNDVAVYNCDASLPACRSILKHFPETVVKPTYQKSVVITADPIPTVYTNVIANPCIWKSTYEMSGETYDVLDSYETNCQVKLGMSGSILFSLSNTAKYKIIGIQTCKNNNGLNENGFFKPVSQEQLKSALIALKVEGFFPNIDNALEATSAVVDSRCPPNLNNNSLTYIGTVPKAKQIKQQNVSKLKESLIHDIEARTQEPSVLRDNDDRMRSELKGESVIFRAIEGFDHPIGSVDTEILNEAALQLTSEYDVLLDIPGIERRVLTDFETVNGIEGLMLSLDLSTSPGYPFVLERVNTCIGGKREWFEEISDSAGNAKAFKMKSNLKDCVEQAERQMLNGENPLYIAYVCLKDETRSLEKIANGKTRAFICLPLHFNLAVRKYFGAFTTAQKRQAIKVSSCVGVNAAADWDLIYNKLRSKDSVWEDFDYSNWDQYLHPELVMKVADVINKWYDDGEQNAKVRRILMYNLVHTLIIVKDRLFLKSQGQCSGCAITAELNCLVHDLLMLYVWIKYHKDQDLYTDLSQMREYVALCVYGDDLVMASDPTYEPVFTGEVIAPYMKSLGMNITPGDKLSKTFTKKSPENIYFLKRNFVKDGERILAPLKKEVIENIIQWIHKSDDDREATVINCKTALQESYMHREPYFNSLTALINERVKSINRQIDGINIPPITMSYEDLKRRHIGGNFVCAGLSESLALSNRHEMPC